MASRFLPCPACKALEFNVRGDTDTGVIHVECKNCRAELLRSEQPVTPAAPAGPTHAPAGGPLR